MADINELVNGVYKPTYNWGAPSCMFFYVFPMSFRIRSANYLSIRPYLFFQRRPLRAAWRRPLMCPSATMSTRRLGSPHHEISKKVEVFVDHNFDDVKHHDIIYIYHRIHGAGIYANILGYIDVTCVPYIAYMDPMGYYILIYYETRYIYIYRH